MATNMFPKFQLSYFHGQGKSLQSVFRTDDEAEYDKKLAELLKEQEIDQTLKEATPETQPFTSGLDICKKNSSHGAMVPGRNGKPYCKKCYIEWKNSQGKTY